MLRLAVRRLPALLLVIALSSAQALARDADARPPSRVRGASGETARLLKELVERSPTGRDLVERLERSDATVYIRHEWFPSLMLRGRIGFLESSSRARRVLVIEIAPCYTHIEQMSVLGHELQHALEIADAPDVFDGRTLADLYRTIGDPVGQVGGSFEAFETSAAAAAERRVHSELVSALPSAGVASGGGARN